MKKLIKFINVCILIILIFLLAFICYSKFIKHEELITIFGKGFLVVITESMSPTIESGEFIVISKEDNYEEGDIVTYLDKDEMIVTHRIMEIDNNYFYAKGDNNNITDLKEKVNKIYGKVIFHSKIIGIFILYFFKPIVFIYVLYLIISEIIYIIKNKKTILEDNEKLNMVNEKNNNIQKEDKCIKEEQN